MRNFTSSKYRTLIIKLILIFLISILVLLAIQLELVNIRFDMIYNISSFVKFMLEKLITLISKGGLKKSSILGIQILVCFFFYLM